MHTHDTRGQPLPSFILNRSVAYWPMIPKDRQRTRVEPVEQKPVDERPIKSEKK